MIADLKKQFAEQVLVGVGTVLDEGQALNAIEAGADFIFSLNCDETTIKVTKMHHKISIPGVMTPTEIVQDYRAGADIVKIFSAGILGPNYIKELQGPLGHIRIMPTGGINLENAGEFILNGSVALESGDFY